MKNHSIHEFHIKLSIFIIYKYSVDNRMNFILDKREKEKANWEKKKIKYWSVLRFKS